jgi:hypothetical protein
VKIEAVGVRGCIFDIFKVVSNHLHSPKVFLSNDLQHTVVVAKGTISIRTKYAGLKTPSEERAASAVGPLRLLPILLLLRLLPCRLLKAPL